MVSGAYWQGEICRLRRLQRLEYTIRRPFLLLETTSSSSETRALAKESAWLILADSGAYQTCDNGKSEYHKE
jgi:hypothetical protein